MPEMDGVEALEQIMRATPTRVVMLSSQTHRGADITLKCLEMGAIDFVGKPSGPISLDIARVGEELLTKIKAASKGRLASRHLRETAGSAPLVPRPCAAVQKRVHVRLIVIGASTGGPMALQKLIPAIPAGIGVPVVVVQHMPPMFTASLARRLDDNSPLTVREAVDGDALRPDVVLVAPGGVHLTFDSRGIARLSDEPPVHGVRPAIDVTIASLARQYGDGMLAVLLTGMGRDGARGLKTVSDMGGMTIAEDESTCVVYGMPKAAVELNAVDRLLPLTEIAPAIVAALKWREQPLAA
jgi:two-component system chemotaxis response regulator CheB